MALTAGAITDKINGVIAENILCSYISPDKFYHPSIEKEYELGIIPHVIDRDENIINSLRGNSKVKVIKEQE